MDDVEPADDVWEGDQASTRDAGRRDRLAFFCPDLIRGRFD